MPDIAEFMNRDHHRLDAILADFRKRSDGEQAKRFFSQFESGLQAHIAWEEELLFPLFEEGIGRGESAPTAAMRAEHQRMRELLRSIREGLDGGRKVYLRVPETGRMQAVTIKDGSGVDATVNELQDVLLAHNHKEAQILYPWLARTLTERERAALFGRIQTPHA
ncbi:MAG: hemerythrin domain-containing protein [Acidobacteria bacterium]|nr:hemerythrin domain-containing protein [Acidobacteriota bacterium]